MLNKNDIVVITGYCRQSIIEILEVRNCTPSSWRNTRAYSPFWGDYFVKYSVRFIYDNRTPITGNNSYYDVNLESGHIMSPEEYKTWMIENL